VNAVSAQPRQSVGRPRCCPLEVLERVVRMRLDQGMELKDICRTLNEEGVATPGGGHCWWPSYVHRLLRTRHAGDFLDRRSGPGSWPES
jgi:hypothetical protein